LPQGLAIETEGYQPVSLPGVMELENYLPARLLNPKASDTKFRFIYYRASVTGSIWLNALC